MHTLFLARRLIPPMLFGTLGILIIILIGNVLSVPIPAGNSNTINISSVFSESSPIRINPWKRNNFTDIANLIFLGSEDTNTYPIIYSFSYNSTDIHYNGKDVLLYIPHSRFSGRIYVVENTYQNPVVTEKSEIRITNPVFIRLSSNSKLSVILVNNNDQNLSPAPPEIILGSPSSITNYFNDIFIFEMFFAGIFLTLGLYHLSVHILNERHTTPLWFGILSILLAFRAILAGDFIIGDFPEFLSVDLHQRILFFIYYAIIPFILLYIDSITEITRAKYNNIILIITQSVLVIIFLLSFDFLQKTLPFIHGILVILVFWKGVEVIYTVVREYRRGYRTFLFGYIIAGGVLYIDIYNYYVYQSSIQFFNFGFFIFALAESYYMAARNSEALEKARFLSSNLQNEVAAMSLDLNRSLSKLTEYTSTRNIEFDIASDIQGKILGDLPCSLKTTHIEGFCNYRDTIGGDYYNFFRTRDENDAVVIADASGHGASAALLTAMVHIAFTEAFQSKSCPSEILYHVNSRIIEAVKGDIHLTALVIVIEKDIINIANASHIWPILYQKNENKTSELEIEGGMFIGLFDNSMQNYRNIKFPFLPGDRLMLVSDGFFEQNSESGELYGEERTIDAFYKSCSFELNDSVKIMQREWNLFRGNVSIRDDVTLLVIEGKLTLQGVKS